MALRSVFVGQSQSLCLQLLHLLHVVEHVFVVEPDVIRVISSVRCFAVVVTTVFNDYRIVEPHIFRIQECAILHYLSVVSYRKFLGYREEVVPGLGKIGFINQIPVVYQAGCVQRVTDSIALTVVGKGVESGAQMSGTKLGRYLQGHYQAGDHHISNVWSLH